MRKTVNLELKNQNNEPVVVDLRLTIMGQKTLKKKYNEEGMSLIMSAINDTEKMLDIFRQALAFAGNDNTVTDAEELYDLLVDNGCQGMDGFADLLIKIGEASGIFKQKQAERLAATIAETFDKAFDEIQEDLIGSFESAEEDEKVVRFPESETTE